MTIVFFCPNILRDAHKSIFQLERLKKEGYKFILLDATKYYGNESTATEKIILENKVECNSKNDFVAFKNQLPKETVLYVTFDFYMRSAAPILQILIRRNDKLLSYHTKRFSAVHLSQNKFRILIDKIIKKTDKFLPLHLLKNFYKLKNKVFIPDYYLCSTNFVVPSKVYFTIKRENRIIVHADDINQTLSENKSSIFKNENKKIGVFLDQAIPYQDRLHPLLIPEPISDEYKISYYKSVEKILAILKNKFALDEVVIALHPDAIKLKEELSNKFKGFRTFYGETHELIKNSAMVFGHSSTAIGYAIYYKKAVILLKDDYLFENFPLIQKFLMFFHENLDMKILDVESPKELQLSEVQINEKKYNEYIKKYLKDNRINEHSYYYSFKRIEKDLKKR
ncbi:hypothetical protein [Autumnicola edwardsiae]|uniref:Capsular biosynthesis protein n=1 Tax=Autumnicola edwardsiae TaxID=3075594 RepID=A0ABU3CTE9_9FLAO|nr:hypothetical protein [Zunongwangia sp. F297]MDT0649641.1 hypothetical protein [Zunongwangia sp. F297]